jgi:hypothetical protein
LSKDFAQIYPQLRWISEASPDTAWLAEEAA